MDVIITLIGMLAGVAVTWFGHVAVSGQIRRRTPAATANQAPPAGPYDAFIPYTTANEDKAEQLARSLHARGIRVFPAKWIGVGLVEYGEKNAP